MIDTLYWIVCCFTQKRSFTNYSLFSFMAVIDGRPDETCLFRIEEKLWFFSKIEDYTLLILTHNISQQSTFKKYVPEKENNVKTKR